jgi:N-acetylneuraminic acid mutarotase
MPLGYRFSEDHRTQGSPRLGFHVIGLYRSRSLAAALGVAAMLLVVACRDAGDSVVPAIEAPSFSNGGGGVWTTKAPMPTARGYLAVGAVNGIIYAVGGTSGATGMLATVEAYDPATNVWTTKASMPTPRCCLAVGAVNGILYAVGGQTDADLTSAVEAYDPVSNTWTTKASLPTAGGVGGIGVINGILYAVAGSVDAYNPATNTWTAKAPIPTSRTGLTVGVANGILYAVGGTTISGNSMGTVEAYDPVTNAWSTKATMPTARQRLAADAVSGTVYAIGGFQGPGFIGALSTVEAYDPTTNTWTSRASTPTSRGGLAAGAVNGIVYAVGGWRDATGYLATVEAFQPDDGPPPPPPQGSPNIIVQDGFETNLSSWTDAGWPGGTLSSRYSQDTTAFRVRSGFKSVKCAYTLLQTTGTLKQHFMPGYDEVFLRFYVMFEQGFQNLRGDGYGMHFFKFHGHRTDNGGSAYAMAGHKPTGTDFFYAGIDPDQEARWDPALRPLHFYTYHMKQPGTTPTSYGEAFDQNIGSPAALDTNVWHEVVYHLKLNDPADSNGVQEMWINGVKKLEVLNLRFRSDTILKINEISFDNYMKDQTVNNPRHIWVDDVVLWRP